MGRKLARGRNGVGDAAGPSERGGVVTGGATVLGVDRSRVGLDPRFPAAVPAPLDGETLFADLFRDGAGRLLLVGGPRAREVLAAGAVEIADAATGAPCGLAELGGLAGGVVWEVAAPPECLALQVRIGSRVVVRPVQPWLGAAFAGCRALLAANPGRPLGRLATWARFHAVHLGVDAVVVAHRAADDPRDVAAALAAVPGIGLVAVVPWDDVVGAPPGEAGVADGWLPAAMLEHARHRLLGRAAWVAAVPVDAALLPGRGRTVDGLLAVRTRAAWLGAAAPGGARSLAPEDDRPTPGDGALIRGWVAVPERCPGEAVFRPEGVAGAPGLELRSADACVAALPLDAGRDRGVPTRLRAALAEALADWEPSVAPWSAVASGEPDLIRAEALRLAAVGEPEQALAVLHEAIRREPWHPAQTELRRDLLREVARRAGEAGR